MVGADTRVYYFDVKEDSNGTPYLVITEIPTKKEKNGKKKRNRLFIHPESLGKFTEAFKESSQVLTQINQR